MKLFQHPFSGDADKHKMTTLAWQSTIANLHVIDLPYRLSSWALDNPDNVGLWFDEHEQLVGWAVLQTPFWTIDYVCHPSVESGLHQQILTWADQRAFAMINIPFGRPAWFIMVFDDQADRIRDMEKQDFNVKRMLAKIHGQKC